MGHAALCEALAFVKLKKQSCTLKSSAGSLVAADWWWQLALHQSLLRACLYPSHGPGWLKSWLMAINDANKGLGFLTKQLPSPSVKLFAIQRQHVKTHQRSKTAKKCPAVVAQNTSPLPPITSIFWRVWACFKWVWCSAWRASRLRQTALHPHTSSAAHHEIMRPELLHQPLFVWCWFRRKRCSHLTLTVGQASGITALCPVSAFDGMRPVANAEAALAECRIMAGNAGEANGSIGRSSATTAQYVCVRDLANSGVCALEGK